MGHTPALAVGLGPPSGAQLAQTHTVHRVSPLAVPSMTVRQAAVISVQPVPILGPQDSQSQAAHLLVQTSDGIELDNIPFINDAAILLDDLPLQQSTLRAVEAVPTQMAQRGYQAGRDAAGLPDSQTPSDQPPLATAIRDPSLGGSG